MKEEFLKILKENTSEVFENIKISDDTRLLEDLGFDSVSLMQLIIEIEEEFGIEFSDINFEQVETVGKMFIYVQKATKEKGEKNED